MVAAVADNGVIGLDGDIPWQISADLKHFRATTTGNTVLMGRRTFESIGHPLPYRTNVVVTRNTDWSAEGVFVAHDVKSAVEMAQGNDGDVMVIGGGHVYADAMRLRHPPGAHRGPPLARGRHPLPGVGPRRVAGDRPRAALRGRPRLRLRLVGTRRL